MPLKFKTCQAAPRDFFRKDDHAMTRQRTPYQKARPVALLGVFAALFVLIGTAGSALESSKASGHEQAAASAAESAEWQSLFDGETLDGWHNPYDWGEAWVEDGEIRLRADKKFFLVTDTTYSDFLFEAEIHLPDTSSNSGFMIRAHVEPNRVYGYQAEVDPSARQWAGGLYDEGRRGWLHPAKDDEAAGEAFREGPGTAFDPDAWNEYRIRAEGDSLKIWVNGEMTTAHRDSMDREGVIAIQHHGEAGKVYRFRNLRVQPLDGSSRSASVSASSADASSAEPNTLTAEEKADGWQLLFDGSDLSGWTGLGTGAIPEGHWTVEDGAIHKVESGQVPTAADGQPLEGGDIMTEETYDDFELTWEWKVAEGANSGIKYNVSEEMSTSHEPERAALGFEYQVLDDERHPDGEDADHRTGALYDMIPADSSKKTVRPPGQWNASRLVFQGNHGEHWLNGQKIVEYDLDSPRFDSLLAASKYADIEGFGDRRTGHIVLQDHGDNVWFRSLKLRPLPAQ